MKSNDNRMRKGLETYLDAMRRYIANEMQHKVEGDWFRDRVLGVFHTWQHQIEEDLQTGKSKEEVLEYKHFPEVICHRDNKESIFPLQLAGAKRGNSIAEYWMREITKWRNKSFHSTMNEISDQDADRALDTCARVLDLVDSQAAKEVRELFDDPQDLQRKLENERAKYEDTKQIADRAEKFERQWKKEQKDNKDSQQNLKIAKKAKSRAEEHKQTAEANLSKLRADRHTIHQNLKSEQENRRKIEQERDEFKQQLQSCDEARQQLEATPSRAWIKPSGVPITKEIEEYRNKFMQPKSRKGRSRRFQIQKDKDWSVTLWVGEVRGKPSACVFAPWKATGSGWEDAGEGSLIDQPCNSEEEAFAYLQRAEQNGEIERRAQKAIEEHNALFSTPDSVPNDSMPDSGSDDDIPF